MFVDKNSKGPVVFKQIKNKNKKQNEIATDVGSHHWSLGAIVNCFTLVPWWVIICCGQYEVTWFLLDAYGGSRNRLAMRD